MKRLSILILVLAIFYSGSILAADGVGIESQTVVKSAFSWDGEALPCYPAGRPEITILRIRVQPGVSLPLHRHPVINAGVLLSGQLTVIAEDGKVLHLKTGDPIVEVVSTRHYGKNEGNTPAEIMVFYAGTTGTPITTVEQPIPDRPGNMNRGRP